MRETKPISTSRYLAKITLIAAVYFAAGRLGQTMSIPPGNVAPIWPASGIALALVMLLGRRIWPGLFLGAFCVTLSFPDWSSAWTFAGSLAVSLSIGTGSCLQAFAGDYIIRRYTGGNIPIRNVGGILRFAAAIPIMCLVSASVGSTSLCLGGAPWASWTELWTTWWLGDSIGVLVAAPLILAWGKNFRFAIPMGRIVEIAVVFSLVTAASLLAFTEILWNLTAYPLEFLPIPFLLWAALRLGLRGTTAAILLVEIIAIASTINGFGPFYAQAVNISLLLLQLFITVTTLTMLVIAAFVEERAEANLLLEERVAERTRDLAASESLKSSILSSALDCIISMDQQGRIIEFNPAAERTFGYRRDEVLGHSLGEKLVPPALRPQHEAGLEHYLQTGEGPVLNQRLELTALHVHQGRIAGAVARGVPDDWTGTVLLAKEK